jgi:hypothetical protein
MKKDSINLNYKGKLCAFWSGASWGHRRFDRAYLLNVVPRPAAGIRVQIQYLIYRFGHLRGCFTNYHCYCSWNVLKSDATLEEGRDSYLISRIQSNRFATSCFDCFVSQT